MWPLSPAGNPTTGWDSQVSSPFLHPAENHTSFSYNLWRSTMTNLTHVWNYHLLICTSLLKNSWKFLQCNIIRQDTPGDFLPIQVSNLDSYVSFCVFEQSHAFQISATLLWYLAISLLHIGKAIQVMGLLTFKSTLCDQTTHEQCNVSYHPISN